MKPVISKDNIKLKGQDWLIMGKDVKDIERAEFLTRYCQKNFNWRQ